MNIKLSEYTPRKAGQTITKVSILILINLTRIDLDSDASHVMKEDTMIETILRTKVTLTRKRETRKDIMLML